MNTIPNEFVLLNGEIRLALDAKISVFDGSIQYGYGLIETLRTYRGVFFAWNEHYLRLVRGCQQLHMKVPFSLEEGERYLLQLHQAYTKQDINCDGVYRMTVTPNLVLNWNTSQQTSFFITRRELPSLPHDIHTTGIEVEVLQTLRAPSITNERVKALHMTDLILARRELQVKNPKAFEGLMLNSSQSIVEATFSNLFAVLIDNQNNTPILWTPSQEDGPLAGVTGGIVKDIARTVGLKVLESTMKIEMLSQCREIFLTNSVHEIVPVQRVLSHGQQVFENQERDFTVSHKIYRQYKQMVESQVKISK
ncbi:hypothetical protein BHU72_02485 [Desulfuribacillus stibiiarsenatis]|uniref:4-amino-4-deoxychorismate lyase n=1 Tax=Desulfuribacillus stibiiarsenatis TaxID=1390249 RepID=A0A1E5L6D1_9FIRM|nr:aminotransferase class IV [Desulfuribacillus stibiiarsenatis]OEH85681.1 hypothetical protein BHU72_02485 [Desulfuribacillus stibiiarsenatis]